MKTYYTLVIATLTILGVSSSSVKAQDISQSASLGSGIRLDVGTEAARPVGQLSNQYRWSTGVFLQAELPVLRDELYATVKTGYSNIFANNSSNLSDIKLIPLKAGLKYFPVKNFYVQGEAGVNFITNGSDLANSNKTTFSYGPQVGMLFKVSKHNYIDAGVNYERDNKFYQDGMKSNFVGLKVAYTFGL